ncbi:MAG: HAMP domain-containing histidine kinase [Magnetococcales bacterium]|nr:HAMP domain-containing histidine kinase [Magnetococcales bacterium]
MIRTNPMDGSARMLLRTGEKMTPPISRFDLQQSMDFLHAWWKVNDALPRVKRYLVEKRIDQKLNFPSPRRNLVAQAELARVIDGVAQRTETPIKTKASLSGSRASQLRFRELIQDVLDIKMIEKGETGQNPCPCHLRPLLLHALGANTLMAIKREVRLHLQQNGMPSNVLVFADGTLLTGLLAGLIANAIRFSLPRGDVVVSILTQPGLCRVSVHDRGQPYEPEDSEEGKFSPNDHTAMMLLHVQSRKLGCRMSFESRFGEGNSSHLDLTRVASSWKKYGDNE